MKRDFLGKPEAQTASQGDNQKNRREFLITSARVIIPTLGLLGLSLSGFKGRASADCKSICTGGCQGACTGCTGSCSGTCHWTCVDTCKDTCKGMNYKN